MPRDLFTRLFLVVALAATAVPASAQPIGKERMHSTAFWRDVCTGQRRDLARTDQSTLCATYLSSFQDASDEYRDAGMRLFCLPDGVSLEAMRQVFVTYLDELAETADFLPPGRAVAQSLMQAYPCTPRR